MPPSPPPLQDEASQCHCWSQGPRLPPPATGGGTADQTWAPGIDLALL